MKTDEIINSLVFVRLRLHSLYFRDFLNFIEKINMTER